ncbi:uncharacterized protein PHACADRAFT_180788 [Phanerochaete carnosa HHB-10118-sp]|uniref:Uncharacterized protein n=1 Tax=Phanerochaete carnosa (strain HHB-10118-sp) TaxID=650164 RepID=K5XF30_PHACS|nr:uncharacterized protein PHACADRAFT_180788 [Phanerochaete carnosa HHB-10118-sp]EKM61697.1 hypothetical protein PHACADRAFT_180788 [Phanerochaete carnosa HHB-10118-sp]
MSSLNVRNSCQLGDTSGNEFVNDVYGFAAFVLSLLTNIWATSLIAYKAWHRRHLLRCAFGSGSVGTRSSKILMLFVDSGLLYCGLWAVLVAYLVILRYYNQEGLIIGSTKWHFVADMEDAIRAVLIDIIGMYPTTLVLLVFLTDFTMESATKVESTPDSPVQPPALNKARIVIRSSDAFNPTATVMTENGDRYTQSVIAILGSKSSADDESATLGNKEHALVT